MKLYWSPEALEDRDAIWAYIANDNPSAAVRMDQLFSNAAAQLVAHPKLGKPGQISGTRELIVHANYRLVYEIEAQTVWVLSLVHTSRLWPPVA